ncbi:MAG: hypothetical protein BZ151_12660 [Desulfobacca sp. 4484_104]|nr:MAG: hypothetical protein BZ151_12660 [Desulfobacca sp. 4484_104]
MKSKNTILVIVVLLVCGTFYWFMLREDAGRHQPKVQRPFAAVEASSWQRLEFAAPVEFAAPEKKPVTLVKKDDRWQVEGMEKCEVKTEMVEHILAALQELRLDSLVTSHILAALQELRLDSLVTSGKEKFADYQVDEQKSSPFPHHMRMRLISVSRDQAKVELATEVCHLQPYGIVHGGVMATLIDTATFWAAFARLPEDAGLVNVDLKLNYLKPVKTGLLSADSWLFREKGLNWESRSFSIHKNNYGPLSRNYFISHSDQKDFQTIPGKVGPHPWIFWPARPCSGKAQAIFRIGRR